MKKLLVSAMASLLFSTAVMADVNLAKSYPADGSMLMQQPKKVQLKFDDHVELKTIILYDAKGQSRTIMQGDGSHDVLFSAPLMPLKQGNYKIGWVVKSMDGHEVKGMLGFMVH